MSKPAPERVDISGARRLYSGGGRGLRVIYGFPLPLYFGLPAQRSPHNVLVELADGRRVVVPRQRWRFLAKTAGKAPDGG